MEIYVSLFVRLDVFHQLSWTHRKSLSKFWILASTLVMEKSFTTNSVPLYLTIYQPSQFSASNRSRWVLTDKHLCLLRNFSFNSILFSSHPISLSLTIHWTLISFAIIWNFHWLHCCSIQWRKVLAPNNRLVCLPWTMQQRMQEKWLKNLHWHLTAPDRQSSPENWLKLFLVLLLLNKQTLIVNHSLVRWSRYSFLTNKNTWNLIKQKSVEGK